MATGRTLADYQRIYVDGYDLSCYALDTGAQGITFEEYECTPLCSPIKGVLAGSPTVEIGPINAVFDNTATSGWHALAVPAQGVKRNLTVLYGIRAAPANCDPCFCVPAYQLSYKANGEGVVNAEVTFSGKDAATSLNYRNLWGHALHVMGAETTTNSSTVSTNNGAETTAGGWLMYHITSITGTGTVNLSVENSSDGATFTALTGATSGDIATASAPTSGIVQLSTTATVKEYLRWQIVFGGSATASTFALAFMRG